MKKSFCTCVSKAGDCPTQTAVRRSAVCSYMIIELSNGFVQFTICGETWYLQCDPAYKQHSMQYAAPTSPKREKALVTK